MVQFEGVFSSQECHPFTL